jgi:propionyl-CoA synthetase
MTALRDTRNINLRYYDTSDAGYFDEDGYLFVMNRTDDVLNVAGHRLSSGAIEEAVGAHSLIAEVAVIGVKDALKGQMPVALVVSLHSTNLNTRTVTF